MSLTEDILEARNKIQDKSRESILFNSHSHIYKCTNENMNDEHYSEQLKDRKRVLTVIGSGDQVLNSIFFNASKIDAFDISRFPKYFLQLKLAAVKVFSYEEYLDFFYGKNAFNRRLYKKVLEGLEKEEKEFWTSIIEEALFSRKNSPKAVYNSKLFSEGEVPKERAINLNPYLEESNFDILKFKVPRVKIKYITGNILKLANTLPDSYDLVNLSNIGSYQQEMLMVDDPNYQEGDNSYKKFIKNLKLNPDGRVLSYLLSYFPGSTAYKSVERYYKGDKDFQFYEIENKTMGEKNDGLLVYQKRK